MLRDLKGSVVAIAVLTVVFGFVFPAIVTGFAQVAFPHQADGSLVKVDGKVVGSRLVGQVFAKSRYFHGRPSATAPPDNGSATTFANLGPTSTDLAKAVKNQVAAILKLEGPYNPGLTVHDIPVDAVSTSASGVDPDISPAYARLQAHRVAAVRHISLASVEHAIHDFTDGRSIGFLGEPGVNVLQLNVALDRSTR